MSVFNYTFRVFEMQTFKLLSFRMLCMSLIIGLLVLYTVTVFNVQSHKQIKLESENYVQFLHLNSIHLSNDASSSILSDILNADVKPNDGRSIFFLVADYSDNDVITLLARNSFLKGATLYS